jgi:hypothetical protein
LAGETANGTNLAGDLTKALYLFSAKFLGVLNFHCQLQFIKKPVIQVVIDFIMFCSNVICDQFFNELCFVPFKETSF